MNWTGIALIIIGVLIMLFPKAIRQSLKDFIKPKELTKGDITLHRIIGSIFIILGFMSFLGAL